MTLREERNHSLGFGILFFIFTCAYGFVAYLLFSNGNLKFGIAMTAFAMVMAGLTAVCLHDFLISRFAEREMKKGKKG